VISQPVGSTLPPSHGVRSAIDPKCHCIWRPKCHASAVCAPHLVFDAVVAASGLPVCVCASLLPGGTCQHNVCVVSWFSMSQQSAVQTTGPWDRTSCASVGTGVERARDAVGTRVDVGSVKAACATACLDKILQRKQQLNDISHCSRAGFKATPRDWAVWG